MNFCEEIAVCFSVVKHRTDQHARVIWAVVMVKFHSLKATINYPFGNGNHTTYKNGDDWGMVRLWHCFTHITLVKLILNTPVFTTRYPSLKALLC